MLFQRKRPDFAAPGVEFGGEFFDNPALELLQIVVLTQIGRQVVKLVSPVFEILDQLVVPLPNCAGGEAPWFE